MNRAFEAHDLDVPWVGAALRLLADPAAHADPAALPGWPGTAEEAAAALSDPALRITLGQTLVPTAPTDVDTILRAAHAAPGVRMALLDASVLLGLAARATAWLDAPRLAALIRRSDLETARTALGEQTWDAMARWQLLPRPGETLLAALGLPGADEPMLAPGARMLGLALGPLPPAVLDRFRLRRPALLWAVMVEACRDDPVQLAARAAFRRLYREEAPAWLTWSF